MFLMLRPKVSTPAETGPATLLSLPAIGSHDSVAKRALATRFEIFCRNSAREHEALPGGINCCSRRPEHCAGRRPLRQGAPLRVIRNRTRVLLSCSEERAAAKLPRRSIKKRNLFRN